MSSMGPTCPYCGDSSELKDSAEVYGGRSYGPIWLCENYPRCDAYVGCHPGTEKPLGRLADAELRKWKVLAHRALDRYWQSGKHKRNYVYERLAKALKIPVSECHIGMFDSVMCKRVVKLCSKKKK